MSLEDMIREAYAAGSQVHLWPQNGGAYAAVRSRTGVLHVSRSGAEPVTTLRAALTEMERLQRDNAREHVADPRQIDLETAIAATTDDDFEGLM